MATKAGICADIKHENVTVGNVFELMPFENAVTVLEISGEDMNTLLHFIAKTEGQPVSGYTLLEKPTEVKNAAGKNYHSKSCCNKRS